MWKCWIMQYGVMAAENSALSSYEKNYIKKKYIYIHVYIYTEQIINTTLLFLPPFFMSWAQRSKTCTQKDYFSQILFTNLSKSVLVATKTILHKLPETISGKLICMLDVLNGVSTWLQFVIVTDLSGQILTFDGVWHFREVFSSRMNPGVHCTGQMADSVYGIVWVSGLLMSTSWIEWPMVAVGLWYGQAYVINNKHRCILLMAFWMHRDTVTRYWGPLLCHSSTTIPSCCSMIMHGPMLQGSVHNSWKLKTSQFLHGQHTHRTCHPLSMFGMLWIYNYCNQGN